MKRIVVIGTSLGGMKALEKVLSALPADFASPVAVVQHRGKGADEGLVAFLAARSKLEIREAEDKEPISSARVYVAPADYHLLVDGDHFALSTEGPVLFARPSIDVLFESAAAGLGAGVVGVVLTGANQDGARGAARIKEAGGIVIVEDPATAQCGVMPAAAMTGTRVDAVLGLGEIGGYLAGMGERERERGRRGEDRERERDRERGEDG